MIRRARARTRVRCKFCGWTYPPGPVRLARIQRNVDRKLEEHLATAHRLDGLQGVTVALWTAREGLQELAGLENWVLEPTGDGVDWRSFQLGSRRAFALAAKLARRALAAL